jgi:hypothetical protein
MTSPHKATSIAWEKYPQLPTSHLIYWRLQELLKPARNRIPEAEGELKLAKRLQDSVAQ